jgi:phosphoadenosine phosphosulfate reductase
MQRSKGFHTENRKECCFYQESRSAINQKECSLITGLRAEQSENRNDLALFIDLKFEIIKFNPLLDLERSGGLSN